MNNLLIKYMILTMLLIFIGLVMVLSYYALRTYHTLKVSKVLVNETRAFEMSPEEYTRSVLVLGDSTAVGVGATKPTESLPALFSRSVQATYVENHAVSGATVRDLPTQIKQAQKTAYTYILIDIGSNDILYFHSVKKIGALLDVALDTLPEAQHVVLLSSGNLASAPAIPFFLKPFYTRLHLAYHQEFSKVLKKHKQTYINLYVPAEKDPFVQQPAVYFARDGFHPSSLGYASWFKIITQTIDI